MLLFKSTVSFLFCFFTFDFVAEIASLELVENDVDWESLWQWGLLGEDFL